MAQPYDLVLEFTRAEHAGQPHAFRFAPQSYLLRTPGGGFESAEFPWTPELLADLRDARAPGRAPDTIHRIGETLRAFLAGAGWSQHERAIVRAAHDGAPILITVRSAAAELYALPWEFVALKSTGQLLGGIPGLLVRYEWPEAATFPDRVPADARRGRVLLAWSAAGGAVPAAEHLAALKAAFADEPAAFDPERDVIAHASFGAIDRALDEAERHGPPVDAVHLLCHGAAIGGTYGLALDDEAAPGAPVTVDAGRMQQLLAAHAGMVRMVVLAACDSSNAGELGNHLGSVAQMIHRAGLQVMIASRFPLSAAGSTRFTAAFYGALAREHAPLERAFVAARDALLRDPGQLDWASVQLYSRHADGATTYPLRLGAPARPAEQPPRRDPLPAAAAEAPPPEPPARPVSSRSKLPLVLGVGAGVVLLGVAIGAAMYTGDPPAEPADPPAPAVEQPAAKPVHDGPSPFPRVPFKPVDPTPTEPDPPPVETPTTPTKSTHRTPPTTIPTAVPTRVGKCHPKLVLLLEQTFRSGVGDRAITLNLQAQASGAVTLKSSSGDTSLLPQVQSRLSALDAARVKSQGGDNLPCRIDLTWVAP